MSSYCHYCQELFYTTKITHKISSHKSYFPILLSLFTKVLVLLISVKLLLSIYKKYDEVIIYKCHILECPPLIDWLNSIIKHILQSSFETYSGVFSNVQRPSKFQQNSSGKFSILSNSLFQEETTSEFLSNISE